MSRLIIKNKKELVDNILSPISNLNDICILTLGDNKLNCTLTSTDATIVLNAAASVGYSGDNINLNIPDIKKFLRLLNCLPQNSLEIDITPSLIKYNDGTYKFTFHLLEDGIIKQPSLNIEKIKQITFDTTFTIPTKNLSALLKGSMFTTDTSKFYIYCEEGRVFGELGDRKKHNCNSFSCELTDEYTGEGINDPIPVNYDSFKLLVINSKDVTFKVNKSMGLIVCEVITQQSSLTYVISALIN